MTQNRKIFDIFIDNSGKTDIISSCMDTKKDAMIPQCGNLEDLASGRFVVGAKQLRKAVAAGRAKYALLAKNADPAVTEPLIALCDNASVAYDLRYSMQEIGKACGIEVGAAAACAVTD